MHHAVLTEATDSTSKNPVPFVCPIVTIVPAPARA
jgi:hypothetical protein